MSNLRLLLFDLDGTLVDTAPDMACALNRLREEQHLPHLPFHDIRATVSHGGAALVRLAFGADMTTDAFEALRARFLALYSGDIAAESRLFEGMDRLLIEVERRGLKWGVVTNKPAWLTDPLMAALKLTDRAACVISGDTLAQRKPDPEPLLHACALAGSEASQCLYVGDALRDVEAGNAAGMGTVVALYGYIGLYDRPETWPASTMISHPSELLQWLEGGGVSWPAN